jgi:uncharacterized protein (DUF983 family)
MGGGDGGHGSARDLGWTTALRRGAAARCPICGQGRIFDGYLSLRPACQICGTALGQLPADDAPPWITILIALHLLIGAVLLLGRTTRLGTEDTLVLMLPAAVLLCLVLLRPVKGCVVAVLLKLDVLHGGGLS